MTGRYQVMPPLTRDEYAQLEQEILDHGVEVPIEKDPDGEIVDGHHRAAIAKKHDLPCPEIVLRGYTEAELRDRAFRLNFYRRNLTNEQKRQYVAERVKASPELSNREHARRTGVSDKTVASVRTDAESRAEIPHVSERTDSLGRQQPARKSNNQQPNLPATQPLSPPLKEPRVNKQHAATRAENERIAESIQRNGSGMVVASVRTSRIVAATDRLTAALNDAAIAISRALNDKDLDAEFMRAQEELHPDAQLETIRRDLRHRIDDLGRKLRELREAAQASSTPEESAARQ